jgi:serine/threonine protein kinase
VCHRDIKPSNILISKRDLKITLIDFNVSKKVEKDQMMYSKSAGTLEYSAPERIKDQHGFTNKIDMWAAGLVLFILLVGSHPFEC